MPGPFAKLEVHVPKHWIWKKKLFNASSSLQELCTWIYLDAWHQIWNPLAPIVLFGNTKITFAPCAFGILWLSFQAFTFGVNRLRNMASTLAGSLGLHHLWSLPTRSFCILKMAIFF